MVRHKPASIVEQKILAAENIIGLTSLENIKEIEAIGFGFVPNVISILMAE